MTRVHWRAAGLVPPPDVHGRRWSAAVADAVAVRHDEIIAVTGSEAPVGGHRAGARLARRTGLPVEKADVEALADAAVAERQAWTRASVSAQDAPAYLGWHRDEFTLEARSRGLRPGWMDRYAREDLDAIATGQPCG
jgi:hypothetical protein